MSRVFSPDAVDPVDHVRGHAAAKLVVVEYGDFECPVCAQAHTAVQILLKKYGERMCFVFRNFPLTDLHPHAEHAAEAAEAAGAQGKFWEMHDRLFAHQLHLKETSLREYARDIELDLQRFDFELKDQVYRQRVQEHIASGRRAEIRSTPAFFVNGRVVDVSFGMQRLEQAIEKALHA